MITQNPYLTWEQIKQILADIHKKYEIRCPIHGFIYFFDWERDVINHKYFQRLRRIKQLAWTDLVYPGATHTRFEHSLGVMHMATLLFDAIVERSKHVIAEMGLDEHVIAIHRIIVRLAALLHDIGHAPFSHSSESLFPVNESGTERYSHEDYSALIAKVCLQEIISNSNYLNGLGITAEMVAGLIEGKPTAKMALYWKDIISGQLDADRMDYLLRDSLHAGVDYGRYDWRRIVNTIIAMPPEKENALPSLGVTEGGWHAAEGLIIARYFMFTQVYFHKTRVIYDHHLSRALSDILPNGQFPPPTPDKIDEYMAWDDWRVLSMLLDEHGGEHGQRLLRRNHYRLVKETTETPQGRELTKLSEWRKALDELLMAEEKASKSWYKLEQFDIPVLNETTGSVVPLSKYSSIVAKLEAINQVRLYVREEEKKEAERRLAGVEE